MKIVGYTVGTSLPKPNFNQTDPTKGDYIKNKPDFAGLKSKVDDIEMDLTGKQPVGDYATKAEAKGYADAKDSAINLAQSAADLAQSAADGVQSDLSTYKTSNNAAVEAIQTTVDQVVDNKVDKVDGMGLSTNDYTTEEKEKLASIVAGAEVNQNAFDKIKVGTTTITADSKTDTLTFVAGNNITLTPDTTNDKITIDAHDTTYSAAGANLGLVKSGGDVTISDGVITVNDDSHNHTISNINGLQAALKANETYTDTKIGELINSAPETLDTLGEVATAIQENETVVEALNAAIGKKVDKVSGKGLSTNDYTTEEKEKLASIDTGANKTTVDSTLSSSSTNPVQNKVVNDAITKLNDLVGSTPVEEQISDAFDDAITGLSVSGKVITYTKGDGTTGTITTQDTNTDTKVTQTVTTVDAAYPLLLAPSGQTANKTTTTYFDSDVTLNPSTNTIAANISGNAATADTADSVIVQTLAAGTDLNNLTTGGYYGCAASATAQAFSNNPLSSAGTGIIVKVYSMGGFIYQEVYGTIAGGIYKRRKNGESWSEWIQMATIDDNVASATKLQTGHTLKVNLARTSASTAFDGTANITNIGVSGTLPIANGGTGATTADAVLTNLGISATAAELNKMDGVTSTTAELNYVDGVTSNIQTQLNGKAPTSHASTATTYGAASASNYGHAMASSTTPKANGTATAGSETAKFARGDHVHPLQTSVSGNAGTATKLETARTISLTGDVTGSATFDGSADASITTTVANDSHSHSNYTPYAKKTATVAAATGWYRIATTTSGIRNNTAIFTINGTVSGAHTIATIMAGTSYGKTDSTHISTLQCSHFSTSAINKARIVYNVTYTGNYAYLEVYVSAAKAVEITVQMVNGTGWTLVDPNTAGSIPTGYSNKEVELKNATISADYFTGSGASLTSLNASNISSGIIDADRLPAASTSAQGAMSAADKTKLDGIATGANKTTVDSALSSTSTNPVQNKVVNTALSGKQATITGAATTITSSNLTASRALVSDTNGKVAVSAVTSTELGYLDGVTSAIQTQLNAKAGTAVATTSANGLMSSTDKTRVDDLYKRVAGYAVTAGTTSAYTATITGVTLVQGTMIALRFNATNAANATLNVNSLGAKPIYYKGAAITASRAPANAVMLLVYDTTQVSTGAWHCVYSYDANSTYSNASLGQGYATCSTAAATVAKTASLSSYALATGGIVSVKFTYDVPANATLNINSKGAKAIYHRGAAITNGVIKAGDIATFIYSSQYHLIAIDGAATQKSRMQRIAFTAPSSGWIQENTGRYTQTVSISGITSNTRCAHMDVDMSIVTENNYEDVTKAWSLIDNAETVDGGIKLTAFKEAPSINLNIIADSETFSTELPNASGVNF